MLALHYNVGSDGGTVESQAGLSIEGAVVQSRLPPFRNLGIMYAKKVSMPGEVKDPTQGVNV